MEVSEAERISELEQAIRAIAYEVETIGVAVQNISHLAGKVMGAEVEEKHQPATPAANAALQRLLQQQADAHAKTHEMMLGAFQSNQQRATR